MAIHGTIPSMLQESIPEMLLVAKFCIEFSKDTNIWPAPGCYGYPAVILLLSIVDSIGSYVEQGTVENHFKVLNNKEYYSLYMGPDEIKIMYNYRNLLSHNTVMNLNISLGIGTAEDPVLQSENGRYKLNLIPFYNVSVKAIDHFLNNPAILDNNQTIINIYRK